MTGNSALSCGRSVPDPGSNGHAGESEPVRQGWHSLQSQVILLVVMRPLAFLLLVAHLGGLAGPAIHARPGEHPMSGCHSATAQVEWGVVETPDDCVHCSTSECCEAFTCSGMGVALLEAAVAAFVPELARATEAKSIDSLTGCLTTPLLPPPRS